MMFKTMRFKVQTCSVYRNLIQGQFLPFTCLWLSLYRLKDLILDQSTKKVDIYKPVHLYCTKHITTKQHSMFYTHDNDRINTGSVYWDAKFTWRTSPVPCVSERIWPPSRGETSECGKTVEKCKKTSHMMHFMWATSLSELHKSKLT